MGVQKGRAVGRGIPSLILHRCVFVGDGPHEVSPWPAPVSGGMASQSVRVCMSCRVEGAAVALRFRCIFQTLQRLRILALTAPHEDIKGVFCLLACLSHPDPMKFRLGLRPFREFFQVHRRSCEPGSADSVVVCMSPVEIPRRYSQGMRPLRFCATGRARLYCPQSVGHTPEGGQRFSVSH